ncbi:uncharacterized protein LOC125231968 [Leguminivora glycinivorella]|uniref:uncharacterized protein LOC125231968 n=1 Tax=Leguminivora glycinivorella TaxID=1035111 RepID=UPI00200C0749|nr:uncharacterized protein LOC125231968 [Leguminivora glycinivorella]
MSSHNNIDVVKRSQIIALHEEGRNISEIARETGVNWKTASLWIQRFQMEGSLSHRQRSGRPNLIDASQRQLMVREYEENGFKPTSHYARLFGTCADTVRRVLHSEGLHNRRPAVKPLLTERHKTARLQFAKDHLDYDWSNVIFTDEKSFRSSQHGRLHLWRRNNTRYDTNNVVPNMESGRISVNMWGWMSAAGPGELVRIPNRANSETLWKC